MLPTPRAPMPAARARWLTAVVAILLVPLIFAAKSSAATTTVLPSADAYVDASNPSTNYGTLVKLRTDGSPQVGSYVKFHVQGLTGAVTKATLTVVPTSNLTGAVDAHPVPDVSWTETGINASNAPTAGPALSSASGFTAGTAQSFDVTPSVIADGDVSFALTSASATALALNSREGGDTVAPKLTITTQDPTPPPPSGDVQPAFPVRAAFFYPWFPEAWNQQGMNPFTKYHPSLGFYDSSSTSVIQNQVRAMEYGNINVGIASWWGQGTPTDGRIGTLLNTTDTMGSNFRWGLYYEQEGTSDPSVTQIASDLAYIKSHYGTDQSFYRVNGRPVVFVYAGANDGCGMADRWKQANAQVNAYIVLKVFAGYKTCASQPDGWHQYSPAVATDSQAGYSYAISPGFNKANEAVRLSRDLTRWTQNVQSMVASKAPFQLVETFNEWGEGTAVESADEWASQSGFGQYLDVLHNNGGSGGTPPPPDTTAPAPPSGLSATAGSGSVSLKWTANNESDLSGYRVYRQNADGSWPATPTATVTSAQWTDSGRTNGTTYTYRVTAFDSSGNESQPSGTASATPVASSDTTAPSAPGGLTATGNNASVALSWSASTDNVGVTGYKVYRRNADGTWPTTALATTSASARSYTDSGLTNGTAYTYRVTAVDAAANESTPSATASATPSAPSTTGPCGKTASHPATWSHVVWVIMENHRYSQVIGSSSAPYENSLANQCGLATNYKAITHPSLPNYVAMVSGGTQGVTDDNPPSSHPLTAPSIFSQLGTGGAWRSLQESMPSNCLLSNSGQYAVKHNPAAYFTNIRTDCGKYDVPLGSTPDVSAKFTFVTPNMCNDTHDCSVTTGDNWLKTFIPKITSSAEYQAGNTAIFLTWDEDDMTSVNQVANIVISPSTTPGTKSGTAFNHYSMLRSTEEMLGINQFLGGAANATSMRSAFNL